MTELRVFVTIIGVLVAISIPIFTSQLEKAREATDLANVRAAYAEVMTSALTSDKKVKANYNGTDTQIWNATDKAYEVTVSLKQAQDGWQTDTTTLELGGVKATDTTHWTGAPKANGSCVIKYVPAGADGTGESLTLAWS